MSEACTPERLIAEALPMDAKAASGLFETWFADLENPAPFSDAGKRLLGAVFELSPFLRECANREGRFLCAAFEDGFDSVFDELLASTDKLGRTVEDEKQFMTQLRKAKRRFSLVCGVADLGGFWKDREVTAKISAFARASLSACFDFLLLKYQREEKLKLVDPDNPQHKSGLIVLGMGKFGADELNYSSDIDLVIFHDPSTDLEILSDDPITVLNRMIKHLVKLMQERTADGYVFRTDLRLRPDPSSTPLIIPTQTALHYYEGQGQNWERAAMIKATPVAGDKRAGQNFLDELIPFIWRKYLDFAAIQDVHSIKRQIHAHKGHGEIRVNGHNIKLGRGGIREIEFFVQTQQLIAGGRNPSLRQRGSDEALCALTEHGWIEGKARDDLSRAYWFLRNVEHRLQMMEDQQVHSLPDDTKDIALIAALSGEVKVKAFNKQIMDTLKLVERYYAQLFETAPELSAVGGNLVFTGQDDDPGTLETLQTLGFENPANVIKIVKNWHVAKIPALQTSQARELLTELVPELLEAFGKSAKPDQILYSFDEFLSGLPAGIQLFSILKSNPALNNLLVRILTAAPAMAEQISRKPHVFDAMLEPRVADEVPGTEYLRSALMAGLQPIENYEMKLDQARRFFREIRFQISSRFFAGSLDYIKTANAISNLAEAMVSGLLEVVEHEFEQRHGRIPGAKICVLAMGRLGSRELTAQSDLDLIFLYDFDETVQQSDGDRPLEPSLYFIRFMQRFIAAMSSPTAEGKIFDLDFRLRPSGNAGPLATHVDAFFKYQREDAWVWESQALTRARTVAGDADLCSKVSSEIPSILRAVAQEKEILPEIYKMRMLIEKERGTDNPWDVKASKGGIIDIEFIAQWLVLTNCPTGVAPVGTREILGSPVAEILEASHREKLLEAFDLYSSVMHLLRTCLGNAELNESFPQGVQEVLCTSLDLPDIATCEAYLKNTQKEVREIFLQVFGQGSPK